MKNCSFIKEFVEMGVILMKKDQFDNVTISRSRFVRWYLKFIGVHNRNVKSFLGELYDTLPFKGPYVALSGSCGLHKAR